MGNVPCRLGSAKFCAGHAQGRHASSGTTPKAVTQPISPHEPYLLLRSFLFVRFAHPSLQRARRLFSLPRRCSFSQTLRHRDSLAPMFPSDAGAARGTAIICAPDKRFYSLPLAGQAPLLYPQHQHLKPAGRHGRYRRCWNRLPRGAGISYPRYWNQSPMVLQPG